MIKSFDIDTGQEMYWQFNNRVNKWGKCYVKNAEDIRFFSSLGTSVSFWINGQGKVFAEGYVEYNSIGCMNSNKTGLSKPVKISFFNSIQEPVINIITGLHRAFALCGSIIRFDEMIKICSFWIHNSGKLIPNEIAKIIYKYIGNNRRIFSTGSCPNGHPYEPGNNYGGYPYISDWAEIAAFKDIQIVSVACARNCTLFLDIHGNVHQCHSNVFGRHNKIRSTAPYLIEYFFANNIKIIKIICDTAWKQNVALDANGQVWSWGSPAFTIPRSSQGIRQPKPKLKRQLSKYKIIDIQVRSNVYYFKTEDDKHYLFGRLIYGQSKLKRSRYKHYPWYADSSDSYECSPVRIDKKFTRKTNCKIQNVYLGDDELFIVGIK